MHQRWLGSGRCQNPQTCFISRPLIPHIWHDSASPEWNIMKTHEWVFGGTLVHQDNCDWTKFHSQASTLNLRQMGKWSLISIALFPSIDHSNHFATLAAFTYLYTHPYTDGGTNCSSGAIWGSGSCSRTLGRAAWGGRNSNKQPSDH